MISRMRLPFFDQQYFCSPLRATLETHSSNIYTPSPTPCRYTPAKMSTQRWSLRMAVVAVSASLLGLLPLVSADYVLEYCSDINTSSMQRSKPPPAYVRSEMLTHGIVRCQYLPKPWPLPRLLRQKLRFRGCSIPRLLVFGLCSRR